MPFERSSPARCFMTPPPPPPPSSWKSRPSRSPTLPFSETKKSPSSVIKGDLFHVIHKVPAGDSPYVKAKQVQLVDKDPGRAISMFWAAINAGDRVESALKDMALVMKQLNRSDEAIEAIKSFRHLCPSDSQESLDNILVELYKRSGRVDEEIAMLHHKLKQIEDGVTFVGRTTKQARSQGKKIQITAEQEISRILGNLAWAYLQKEDYKTAEEHYRKALSFEVDRNKQCNLAVCLMQMNRITEAKFLLQAVTTATKNRKMDDSFVKSYERACQMLTERESSSQCTPQSFDNSNGKNPDNVKSRAETRSSTSEVKVSHARRRLYESPDPERRDLKAPPHSKPKRSAWGFNNGYQRDLHSDPRLSFGSFSNDLPSPSNGKWRRTRALESPSIAKHGDTRVVMSSDSPQILNTEAEVKSTVSHDMVLNGSEISRASSAGSRSFDNNKSSENSKNLHEFASVNQNPAQKMSWADIVEEEEQELFSRYTSFDGEDKAEVFNDENKNLNIMYQHPWLQSQTESSRNPTARRSLCFNPEKTPGSTNFICSSKSPKNASNSESCKILAKDRDALSMEMKPTRRNRLQVFQDITLHPETT